MEHIIEEVFHKLDRIVLFSFDINGYTIEIGNTIFVIWVVIALLTVFSFFATRKLSVDKPGKVQIVLEMLAETVNGLCKGSIGSHHYKHFTPYIGTLLVFLGLSNIIAIFNFIPGLHLYPPTKDINVTGALALMSVLLSIYAGLRFKGPGGWLKSFAEPMPVMAPFKLMEMLTKPLSLCLRLFGNVFACFVIMELIYGFFPPVAGLFSTYFDIFDGILQAFIFVYLTTIYIGEAVE